MLRFRLNNRIRLSILRVHIWKGDYKWGTTSNVLFLLLLNMQSYWHTILFIRLLILINHKETAHRIQIEDKITNDKHAAKEERTLATLHLHTSHRDSQFFH